MQKDEKTEKKRKEKDPNTLVFYAREKKREGKGREKN